jgi:carboxypeptidase PM20D1
LLPFTQRAVFANLWPAILQAGTKDNVLPSVARAVVNFRILPGDSVAGVVEHVRRVVDDARVGIRIVGRFSAEPSAVSSRMSTVWPVGTRTVSLLTAIRQVEQFGFSSLG